MRGRYKLEIEGEDRKFVVSCPIFHGNNVQVTVHGFFERNGKDIKEYKSTRELFFGGKVYKMTSITGEDDESGLESNILI